MLAHRKSLQLFALLLALIYTGIAQSEDFAIEDPKLGAAPVAIESVIRAIGGSDFKNCKLIGKSINLDGKSNLSGYAGTTADGCNWGAALGPIWVVQISPNPTVVLSHGGYSLTLGKQTQHGLRHIAISSGTARQYTESLWKFDGQMYVKTREFSR